MADVFPVENSTLPLRVDMHTAIGREWVRLSQPGTWWTGAQRVAIAAAARSASNGEIPPATVLDPPVATMVGRVAVAAHEINRAAVDTLVEDGVSLEAYTELVGIVARTTAIDTAVRGIGAAPVPFPSPVDGEPTRARVAGAKRRSAHVPMVGAAGAITALSAVAAEDAAQADLHGGLYLGYHEMGDFQIVKDIPRWQMELAATMTSWLNHCVY